MTTFSSIICKMATIFSWDTSSHRAQGMPHKSWEMREEGIYSVQPTAMEQASSLSRWSLFYHLQGKMQNSFLGAGFLARGSVSGLHLASDPFTKNLCWMEEGIELCSHFERNPHSTYIYVKAPRYYSNGCFRRESDHLKGKQFMKCLLGKFNTTPCAVV